MLFVACYFFLKKNLSGIQSECQTVWIHIWPDLLSGFIWVQTICQGYQQTTLVGNELHRPMIKETHEFVKIHKGIYPRKHQFKWNYEIPVKG